MITQQPYDVIFGDTKTVGEFVNQLEVPMAFNFEWLTKNNPYARDPLENVTFIAYSMLDKGSPRLISGDGRNSVLVSRSGGYAHQLFRNPYEAAVKIKTLVQYDGYAKFSTYGEFEIMPHMKIRIADSKGQFVGDYYVDSVVHEITSNQSLTHVYVFTNSTQLKDVVYDKIKNTLEGESGEGEEPEEDNQG